MSYFTQLKMLAGGLFVMSAVLAPKSVALSSEVDLFDLPIRPHLIVDMDAGQVLSHQLAFAKWAPASLTKMMAAYTVFKMIELQSISMQSPVRISEHSYSQPPSRMGFPIGTVFNIETALKIIMVKSANDVSVALAEATSGSEAQFVSLMNAHARRLGMSASHFTNPHGLHDPDQYTTARDMAFLTMQLTKEFPQYASFFNIPAIQFKRQRLRNHNALVRLFDGTNGMKTGYVCASGFNVAVRTNRNGKTLLAIVFGGKSGLQRNIKAARLLRDGFDGKLEALADFADFNGANSDLQTANVKPYDITKSICPTKYPSDGTPTKRPLEAPKAYEFEAIDTRIVIPEGGFEAVDLEELIAPLPSKRPTLPTDAVLSAGLVLQTKPEIEEPKSLKVVVEKNLQDVPLTRRQLAALYFEPAEFLRKDIRIRLGGGTGPNPHGLKHTNGDVYQPPIPVPIKRPALDLNHTSE